MRFSIYIYFTVLWCVFGIEALPGQNIRIGKLEIGRLVLGEYGAVYEKKIFFTQKRIPTHDGYYEREMYTSGRTAKQARLSWAKKAGIFLTNDRNKCYTLAAGAIFQDDNGLREQFSGGFFRAGIRRYFTDELPGGFYIGIGAGYEMYYAENYNEYYETIYSALIHRPSVTFPLLGWQLSYGQKRCAIIDFQLGADWGYSLKSVREPSEYPFHTPGNIRIFFGISAGVASVTRRSIF